jgi:hypothetical protein
MTTTTAALNEIFAAVRHIAAAHASALDELERAFFVETVILYKQCPRCYIIEEDRTLK